jgi:hypothetical protein
LLAAMQPIIASLFLLAVAAAARGGDGMVWQPARLLSAEEVAASGAFVPLPIPTTFDNFRYPFIQPDRSVVFIANDHLAPSGHRGRAGIYHVAADGKIAPLVSAGDQVANGPGHIVAVDGLKMDGGRMVFRVDLDSGVRSIALWERGVVTLLASTGGGEAWSQLGYPDISGDNVVFVAIDADGRQNLLAVDLAAADRRPRVIVPHGAPMPGAPDGKFLSFGFQQMADGRDSVFRGFSVPDRAVIWRDGPASGAAGGVYRKGTADDEPPVRILDTSTPLPGGEPGETFTELQNALPRDGSVVVPNWNARRSGIYHVGPDGTMSVVADTATEIPGLFGGPFRSFHKWAANCPPWVLFRGYADGGYAGLFALHTGRRELSLLLDNRLRLDGKEIRDFEIGVTPKIDDEVVVMVEFADGSSGVYLLAFGDGRGQSVFRAPGG